MNSPDQLNEVNQFLTDRVTTEGVQTSQLEDGALHVNVPVMHDGDSLFTMDGDDLRRFYNLASGLVGLDIEIGEVEGDISFFRVDGLTLPYDQPQYEYIVKLGHEIAGAYERSIDTLDR
jgi:hypothetical protein